MQRAKKVWKPVTKSVEESSQSEARVQPKNIMHGNDNVQEGNIQGDEDPWTVIAS